MKGLTIGRLAKASGIGVETIRYYQSRGLLRIPEKPARGYRRYNENDLHQLAFIRRAKAFGFSLAEITGLLAEGNPSCSATRQLASVKLAALQVRIAEMQAMATGLEAMISQCDQVLSAEQQGAGRDISCPAISHIKQNG